METNESSNFDHCLVCNTEMEQEHGLTATGTVFYAEGNYGSTVFDPMHPSAKMQIWVCNPCLEKRKERSAVVVTRIKRTEERLSFREFNETLRG